MIFFQECLVKAEVYKVRAFFNNTANLLKITPFSFLMKVEPLEELSEGLRVKLKFLGFTFMESLIRDLDIQGFTDIALRKPPFIKHWEHKHRFIPKGASTVIEDLLTVDTCLPASLMRSSIELMFKYRCRAVRKLIE
ncbi:MAG: hypothetical protein RMK21_00310 [Aquificaceae bacterium]|nr:hypothetical protein [Aquificaceae bacterium]